jgi:hypothetical protein
MHLLLLTFLLLAQQASTTNLAITGAESATFASSDANACYVDDSNALNVQLTDPSSAIILSFHVLATPGDPPALNQVTALTLDGPPDDAFVNWSAASGTVTLDDLSATVPVEAGDTSIQASTHGVMGHIDAELNSKQGSMHVLGAFACHRPD